MPVAEKDTETETHRHGDQKLGLKASFHDDGGQPRKCGQRGQNDGSKPEPARSDDRFSDGDPLFPHPVGGVDQHQGIVDHNPGQAHHPHEAQQTQIMPHDKMPRNGPHKAERDSGHDHQGLTEGLLEGMARRA